MSEMGEFWKEVKSDKQSRSAQLREEAPKILKENGIRFTSHNSGAHLIVENKVDGSVTYDFWPGTGKWHHRTGGRKGLYGNGIQKLLKIVLEEPRKAEKQS